MRLTKTIFLLERDRIVIQRILFGRKTITETFLDEKSEAGLVESYQENNVSVYKVQITGSNRTDSFGTALSDLEKKLAGGSH